MARGGDQSSFDCLRRVVLERWVIEEYFRLGFVLFGFGLQLGL